jgi:hypothetical protein
MKAILNIAGGKIKPFELDGSVIKLYDDFSLLVNLDKMYYDSIDISEIITAHSDDAENDEITEYNLNLDVYEFLERYHIPFDGIAIYRFLEHVPKVQVLYFIYLLSTMVKIGGYVDVIVPDYKKLAKRIIEEDVFSNNFEAEDIITTFELLNEPSCSPHASIWTTDRVSKFFELEGRFHVDRIYEDYNFDGRDIYLRFLAQRVK